MQKIQSFSDINEETIRLAGGKGGTLAQLYQSGYPVPNGFVILIPAFNDEGLLPEAWEQVKNQIGKLKQDNSKAFAVRSSALSEDAGQTSFAGEFETVLGVKSEEEILEAIHTVWRSRRSERVKSYSKIHGVEDEHEIAVVVQSLVDSDISGVLFTVDPVTGKREMLGNYIHGLGDKLVSGEADALDFRFQRPDGTYKGPTELEPFSTQLYQVALDLEEYLEAPQDIEWAVADNNLYILQSRPITTLNIHDPKRGYYNESLVGDYLWFYAGVGENLPGIMKPSTWSVWKIFFSEILEWEVKGHPAVGNIAGRPYTNQSVIFSFTRKIYGNEKGRTILEPAFGKIPDTTLPLIDIAYRDIIFNVMPGEIAWQMRVRKLTKEIPEFIETNAGACEALMDEIMEAETQTQLLHLWRDKVKPLFIRNGLMLKTINEHYQGPWLNLAGEVKKLVGKQEADLLMSTIGNTSDELASLGVLTGVSKVAAGEMSRKEYMDNYGHRFPDEWHLHSPRPYETPTWLDEQVQKFRDNPFDLDEIASKQKKKFNDVWGRFQAAHPNKSRKIRRKLDRFASLSVEREQIRSEIARTVCVIRKLFLRAGELTGLGDDVFLLTYPELEEVLAGDHGSLKYVEERRATDLRLRQLPEYPAVISGAFNPFTWSKNPDRRVDVYDSHQAAVQEEEPGIIRGNPGSGGVVEGVVRVIGSLEEGHLLRKGEILVTSTTNIGWTPMFPRALAVVTDIGVPLAHAAIVAREIGIPAVVGCGNATTRLKSGDRVQVDGDQGVVRLLES